MSTPEADAKPFLKWVGGKGQLLEEIRAAITAAGTFRRYHEPFVGGGAVFFDLARRGALPRAHANLSDNNEHLVSAYRGVKEHVEQVILLLAQHKAQHGHDHYYAVRAQAPTDLAARAARVIYLNKTCFNGLYRENSRGLFNVPIGRYKNPLICDEKTLRAAARALRNANIEQRSFTALPNIIEKGDFVYFDPPYDPVSSTANFTGYDKGTFTREDQEHLAELFKTLRSLGVKALLSNSDTPFVRKLYKGPNLKVETVRAMRMVNSKATHRGKVNEVLVRNF